ncbi:hypothetical protein ymoll0001_31500 [Yersinia mollaretii ATCC 43969]|uniref:Uncharacterized protein n=1 Tax=Yersinia mollaretii (strain ATCC 43969 / DSM 18520 / CIP 103324 / CNY 7263 / WAIP 204) TaxID=349967 RepID=A0ABP2E9T3_YERMW|nr:hypothetical protein ymoll0001_31500 [Yersinia mollaretii ATCC 43969]
MRIAFQYSPSKLLPFHNNNLKVKIPPQSNKGINSSSDQKI